MEQGLDAPLPVDFHRLSYEERLRAFRASADLTHEEWELLSGKSTLPASLAENFIENVIGYFPIPLGIATHFRIDGEEMVIPMAVEETSIIAAASATAKWIRAHGTITTYAKGQWVIGQIQLPKVKDFESTLAVLQSRRAELIALANESIPSLKQRGGGVEELEIRVLDRPEATDSGKMMVIHVLCNTCDAMGANIINQVCELLKPWIESFTNETVGLCILSNLVDGKRVGAEVSMSGIDERVGNGLQEAAHFAEIDPYRAATHNKGVLNGIDPILIATGNDWRAVAAGIHAFASRSGKYMPVTQWRYSDGVLKGNIDIPMSVGTVGGMTREHPLARMALRVMGIRSAEHLARVCAAVGLVQNLGALRALSTVGIVKGHMRLHASNLALAAGALEHEIGDVRAELAKIVEKGKAITLTNAREILEKMRVGST